MATKTGPDLSFATIAVEALMDDVCVFLRDTNGPGDGTFDRNTGKVVDSAPVPAYAGRCNVGSSTLSESSGEREEGGAQLPRQMQTISIPLSWLRLHPEDEPAEGDIAVIVSARRDPELVGCQYNVVRVINKTMAVSRRVVVNPRPLDALVELPEILELPVGAPVPDGTPPGTLIIWI